MKPTARFENPAVEGYRDLVVWQKGMEITKLTYSITRTFPADERFGLVSQMRRAAVSIPSNIAEGQARHTTGEFIQFISHAEGSVLSSQPSSSSRRNFSSPPSIRLPPASCCSKKCVEC
jgi:hypothetical protein